MKKLIGALVLLAIAAPAIGDEHVKGYVRKDGTYVQPYERSSPNSTKLDNYSTKGNVNPYTGQPGTKDPYSTPSTTNSSSNTYKAPCYYNCAK